MKFSTGVILGAAVAAGITLCMSQDKHAARKLKRKACRVMDNLECAVRDMF